MVSAFAARTRPLACTYVGRLGTCQSCRHEKHMHRRAGRQAGKQATYQSRTSILLLLPALALPQASASRTGRDANPQTGRWQNAKNCSKAKPREHGCVCVDEMLIIIYCLNRRILLLLAAFRPDIPRRAITQGRVTRAVRSMLAHFSSFRWKMGAQGALSALTHSLFQFSPRHSIPSSETVRARREKRSSACKDLFVPMTQGPSVQDLQVLTRQPKSITSNVAFRSGSDAARLSSFSKTLHRSIGSAFSPGGRKCDTYPHPPPTPPPYR
jgi:hypothetical protein